MQPLWHMPFIRSDLQDLVGRRNELDALELKLLGPGKRGTVALLGLGGMGKSRLERSRNVPDSGFAMDEKILNKRRS